MKHLLSFFLLLLPAVAGLAAEAGVLVRDAYVRGLPPTVRNTAAYMTITNPSGADLTLVGAESPAAEAASLHETVTDNGGAVTMLPVAGARVPAGGELRLESGGLHLMLTGLQEALRAGDEVELTLRFADGSGKRLVLPVRDVRDEGAAHDHGNH